MEERHFDIRFEFSPSSAAERIACRVADGGVGYVCGADGNIIQMVHRDASYRDVIDGAMFSICDSSWAAMLLTNLYGRSFSQYCGSQIFDELTKSGRYRHFFLGTSDKVLDALRDNLCGIDRQFSGMRFMSLPFGRVEDFDYPSVAAEINADSPDIIWVALGAPKQEIFMSMLKPFLKRGVMIGVGAVFNFRSGVGEKRAPQWMVKAHLEWLYRILKSPGKQIKRCWRIVTAFPAVYKEEKKRSRQ